MEIFVEQGEWAYIVLKLGKFRMGWYHGVWDSYKVWRVRCAS